MEIKDYRRIIIEEGKDRFPELIVEWNSAKNYLHRTLIYELSPYKDVEHYPCVTDDYENYVVQASEKYATADIMNGWWYCFKTLFGLDSTHRRKGHPQVPEVMEKIKDIEEEDLPGFLFENYPMGNPGSFSKDCYAAFLKYVKVVYTPGNITPAPINPSPGNGLDDWEYKLNRYKKLYHDYHGDVKQLLFQDYLDDSGNILKNHTCSGFKNAPDKYILSRIDKILRRTYRIEHGGSAGKIEDDEIEELKDQLGSLI